MLNTIKNLFKKNHTATRVHWKVLNLSNGQIEEFDGYADWGHGLVLNGYDILECEDIIEG